VTIRSGRAAFRRRRLLIATVSLVVVAVGATAVCRAGTAGRAAPTVRIALVSWSATPVAAYSSRLTAAPAPATAAAAPSATPAVATPAPPVPAFAPPAPSSVESPIETPPPPLTAAPLRVSATAAGRVPPSPPTPQPVRIALATPALRDFAVLQGGPSRGFLELTIANLGPGDIAQQPLAVEGFDQTGREILQLTTGPLTIPAGTVVLITTSYRPTERTMLTVVINRTHAIPSAAAPSGFDDPYNKLTKAVSPP
jgi:hypothetical protein